PFKYASAVVFPPQVPDLFAQGAFANRPPIIIEGIGLTGPGGPKMVNSPAVRNIDPRGQWNILVSSNLYQPDATAAQSADAIEDIKLHLALTAVLSSDPNSWS